MLYQYAAYQNGRRSTSILEAEDLFDAKKKLSKKGVVFFSVKPFVFHPLSLAKKDLLFIFHELSKLLFASVPLYEALIILEEKYQKTRLHPLFLQLLNRIKSGKSFSESLKSLTKGFDLMLFSMIKNAEKAGNLDKTLEEIASLLQRELTVKKKILSALLYPALLLLFCIGVLSLLFSFILPSLFELFEGRKLHPFTQAIFTFSRFFQSHIHYFQLGALFLIASGVFLAKKPKLLLEIASKIPLFNKLLLKWSLIRFCRSFFFLLEGGVSYVEALSLAKGVIRHPLFFRKMQLVEEHILQGATLSEELCKISFIPSLVYRMVAISEKGGGSSMLLYIADFYEEEMERFFLRLTTLLQPLMLLFLGIIVGFVVISVLLPLTDVSSFLSNE